MTSHHGLALSSPSWGTSRRLPLGGLALVALWALLWGLFLGTVGAPGAGRDAQLATAHREAPFVTKM
jgi:hypothetical protein